MNGQAQPPEVDVTSDLGATEVAPISSKKSEDERFDFLDAAAKRAFSESEVAQAITIRFLVERLKEAEKDIETLRPFHNKSYELDRDLQIERGKAKLTKAQEVVSLCLTTIGGAGIGLSLKLFDKDPPVAIAAFVLFASLVATGVYLKVSSK